MTEKSSSRMGFRLGLILEVMMLSGIDIFFYGIFAQPFSLHMLALLSVVSQ